MTRVAIAIFLSLFPAGCSFLAEVPSPATVREIWRFRTGGFVDSIPVVSGGTVFAGSWDHRIYALDAEAGTLRWSFDAGDFVDASPLVAGGKVYACSWNRAVRCLDSSTGRPLWRFEMPPSAFDDHRQSSPSLAGGNILVGGFNGYLYALDRETGRKAWELPTGGPIRATPNPGGFAASEDGALYSFVPETGALRWKTAVGGAIVSSPVAAGGRVWFGCRDGKVYGADAVRGEISWRYETGSRIEYSSPLVVEGMLFIGDCGGTLHAVRLSDAAPEWTFRAGAPIYSSPVIVGGSLVFGDNAGRVRFLDPATGREQAAFQAGGPVQAVSAGPGGSVLCGSRDGHIYRLKRTGGAA